jgi:hypothetical protein
MHHVPFFAHAFCYSQANSRDERMPAVRVKQKVIARCHHAVVAACYRERQEETFHECRFNDPMLRLQ